MQIVFPCPNCGASQSVDDSASSTQCQFCGNTIAVPAAVRGAGQQTAAPYAPAGPASGMAGIDYGHDRAKLAAGQEIQVGTTATGGPEYLQVSAVAPPASYAYYAPIMTPVIPDTNRIWRGVMGFNILITLGIFAFTGCIILFVFLAVGLALFPGLLGLGQILSQLTPR